MNANLQASALASIEGTEERQRQMLKRYINGMQSGAMREELSKVKRTRTTRRGERDDKVESLLQNIQSYIKTGEESRVRESVKRLLETETTESIESIIQGLEDVEVRTAILNQMPCEDAVRVMDKHDSDTSDVDPADEELMSMNAFVDRYGELPHGCELSYKEAFRTRCNDRSLGDLVFYNLYDEIACMPFTAGDVRRYDTFSLRHASEKGYIEVLNLLLEVKGIDARDVRARNNYALRHASANGHVEVVDRLLQVPGIDAQSVRRDLRRALGDASANGHVQVVDRLLRVEGIGAVDDRDHLRAALIGASLRGHVEVVDRLLQVEDIGANDVRSGALRYASRGGHVKVVVRLLQVEGIGANDVREALSEASEGGHVDVVDRLLKFEGIGANDVRGGDALFKASRGGHVNVVDRLLQVVDDPAVVASRTPFAEALDDARGRLALRIAIENGHIEVVNRLLQVQYLGEFASHHLDDLRGLARDNHRFEVFDRLMQIAGA